MLEALAGGLPMPWPALGAAALAGLFGGAHCAAMCGGIAVAAGLGTPAAGPGERWRHAAQTHAGRIAGYTLAGALVGGLGHGLLALAQHPALGVTLRAAVGLVLVLVALRMLGLGRGIDPFARPGQALWQRLRPLQRRLLPADRAGKRIALGLLWGWLPCGLSLSLLGAAWLQANAVHGGLLMLVFGLGTLAVMLPLSWSGARIGQRLQRGPARIAAAWAVLGAGLLTLAAPWLIQVPALHGALTALGCAPRLG
jgi:hypothetical protein